ncbi:MAG: helix-turn-helix transcriptional regulator [Candidatus Cloacimonetes bacterium]|jgi:transcriptional regulator with XRE-family HTH domain|nr:helix-turn-helix transcriptional regulator [Candidatus Cloacimonadota bacterium]MBT7470107.1 helix-turn-helix transcriptional regulator [Candidatus Cloacimonadota bacterium]
METIEIGIIIKNRRKILAITQKDLSEITEVALHTVSDIESGKGNPTIAVLSKICDVLGLDIQVAVKGE